MRMIEIEGLSFKELSFREFERSFSVRFVAVLCLIVRLGVYGLIGVVACVCIVFTVLRTARRKKPCAESGGECESDGFD